MSRLRVSLCLALLMASAAVVEAGHRRSCGCACPVSSCAAPASYAMPSCAAPTCAAPYGGYQVGYGNGYGVLGQNSAGGRMFPTRYPTRGITPAVIPGDEIVW